MEVGGCFKPILWQLKCAFLSIQGEVIQKRRTTRISCMHYYPYLGNIMSKRRDGNRYFDPRDDHFEHFMLMKAFVIDTNRGWHGVGQVINRDLGQKVMCWNGGGQRLDILLFRRMVCPFMVLFKHPCYIKGNQSMHCFLNVGCWCCCCCLDHLFTWPQHTKAVVITTYP